MIEFLRPEPPYMAAALILALVMDFVYPEHRGLTLKLHPVHTSYFMALALAKPYSGMFRGVIVWAIVMASHLAPAALILFIAYEISPLLWVLIASLTLKLSLSLRLLLEICYKAYVGLRKCRLDEGRMWVQMIVRRDVYKLGKHHVTSACIESLSESLVDGFTSPLTYYILLGPLGALAQRIVNTLDGAIGYKTLEYENVGWFSAKMDTIINYIPARLTAAMIIALSPLAKGSPWKALKVWTTYSRVTESLNAGHPISAVAGALEVKLEKPGHYTVNVEARYPEPEDVKRALTIVLTTAAIYTLLAAVILII
ncbi:MAG: cobalamin biosynthesis protein [Thermoprotei archaeon]|nr:cobalamin biosynthesis protein [Thermoprotei archaeon]